MMSWYLPWFYYYCFHSFLKLLGVERMMWPSCYWLLTWPQPTSWTERVLACFYSVVTITWRSSWAFLTGAPMLSLVWSLSSPALFLDWWVVTLLGNTHLLTLLLQENLFRLDSEMNKFMGWRSLSVHIRTSTKSSLIEMCSRNLHYIIIIIYNFVLFIYCKSNIEIILTRQTFLVRKIAWKKYNLPIAECTTVYSLIKERFFFMFE